MQSLIETPDTGASTLSCRSQRIERSSYSLNLSGGRLNGRKYQVNGLYFSHLPFLPTFFDCVLLTLRESLRHLHSYHEFQKANIVC